MSQIRGMVRLFLVILSFTWLWLLISQPVSAAPPEQAASDCRTTYQEGYALFEAKQYSEAVPKLEAALVCYEQAQDSGGRETTLFYLGRSHYLQKNYPAALLNYNQALTISSADPELRVDEAVTYYVRGLVYYDQAQYALALADYYRALEIYQGMEDREAAKSSAFRSIAHAYREQELYAQAISNYRQALAINRALGDYATGALNFHDLGFCYQEQGLWAKALVNYRQALAMYRELGDRWREGVIFRNMGNIYQSQKLYREALDWYQAALDVKVEFKNPDGEAQILADIGETYWLMGQYDKARVAMEQAKGINEKYDDRQDLGYTYFYLGRIAESQGLEEEAQAYYKQSQEIYGPELQDQVSEAIILEEVGQTYAAQGLYPEALEQYEAALKLWQAEPDRQVDASETLMAIGNLHEQQADYTEAAIYYEQAWEAVAAVEPKTTQHAAVLNKLGQLAQLRGDYEEANERSQQAGQIYLALGDRRGQAASLSQLGVVFQAQGNYQTAQASYEAARVTQKKEGANIDLSRTEINLGRLRQAQGRYDEAYQLYEGALFRITSSNAWGLRIEALNYMGQVYQAQGNYKEAQGIYEQAQTLLEEMPNNQRGRALTQANLASLAVAQGDYDQARELYESSLAIYSDSRIADLPGQGQAYLGLGNLAQAQGDYSLARSHYEQVLSLLRQPGEQAQVHIQLGQIDEVQADYAAAQERYEKALALSRELGNRPGEAEALYHLGRLAQGEGRFDRALSRYQQALDIQIQVGSKVGSAEVLAGIGVLYQAQGRYDEALDRYEQALAIYQEIDTPSQQAALQSQIGSAYLARKQNNDLDLARQTYEAALALALSTENRLQVAEAQAGLGTVAQAGQDYAQALIQYKSALITYQDPQVYGQARAAVLMRQIAQAHAAQGDYETARSEYEAVLAALPETDKVGLGAAHHGLGQAYEKLGELDKAREHYEQAIGLVEEVRKTAGSQLGRSGFVAQFAGLYADRVGLLHRQGKTEEAFLASEEGRARAFLDSVATGQAQLADDETAGLRAAEQAAYETLRLKQEELDAARGLNQINLSVEDFLLALRDITPEEMAHLVDLEQAVEDARAKYEVSLTALEKPSVSFEADVYSLADIQAQLGSDTTLLSYFILADRTLVFILTAETLEVRELELTRSELTSAIHELRNLIDNRASVAQERVQEITETLYESLLAGLLDQLQTPQLVIVPHGPLHYLPFVALQNAEGEPLLQHYSVVTLPSASILPFIKARVPEVTEQKVVVLGNPTIAPEFNFDPLPGAEKEAGKIAKLYADTKALLADKATEQSVIDLAGQANILHLAAHGVFNAETPLESAIYLAPDDHHDGRLEVQEIYQLDLPNNDLVVLSACESQVGQINDGDEVVGLTRAFITVGAPTVVATLWRVEDEATNILMERFYFYLSKNRGKAEALTLAQRYLQNQEQYDDPYYWAAFVLSGDGGMVTDATIQIINRSKAPELIEIEQEMNAVTPPALSFWWIILSLVAVAAFLSAGILWWSGVRPATLGPALRNTLADPEARQALLVTMATAVTAISAAGGSAAGRLKAWWYTWTVPYLNNLAARFKGTPAMLSQPGPSSLATLKPVFLWSIAGGVIIAIGLLVWSRSDSTPATPTPPATVVEAVSIVLTSTSTATPTLPPPSPTPTATTTSTPTASPTPTTPPSPPPTLTPTALPTTPPPPPTARPSPDGTNSLGTLVLWGNPAQGTVAGGREKWFMFNSGQDTEATILAFLTKADQVELFIYEGNKIATWSANIDPNALPPHLGLATEDGNRDNQDATREFIWRGPIQRDAHYYVRLVNRGGNSLGYCILTRPDLGSCP